MTTTIRPFAPVPEGAQPPYLHADYGSTRKRAPNHQPIRLEQTLTEVTGPVFADGWAGPEVVDLTRIRATDNDDEIGVRRERANGGTEKCSPAPGKQGFRSPHARGLAG